MENLKIKDRVFQAAVDEFINELNHYANENKANFNYTIMIVNLKNMEAKILSKGEARIFYHQEIISPTNPAVIKLKRGEKITFLSEGVFLNWKKYFGGTSLQDFLVNNLAMNNRDFINELFFELARNKKGTFFNFDALVAMLEIDENILHQL